MQEENYFFFQTVHSLGETSHVHMDKDATSTVLSTAIVARLQYQFKSIDLCKLQKGKVKTH